ncbi:DUF262 domain-containing protein [Rhizorhapis suberifaciens]|uniref:GmrSD restriction endonucleases N-terminal domain-containing protein n=1 Tax=Rhizorhapis suberifaciens TaxID=13656 RepID=A0A840HQG3_9SPHN|nr:DUF262 domain-containing protein [Rhizorhapis suberifaciens]MBB4639838.1 hypothetical protein [Rhizorhapis suberifaciens]
MTQRRKKASLAPERIEEAERQIIDYSKTVKFTVTEYSFEFIVQKLNAERYYVPEYQRELIWTSTKKSKFIESVLMGLPIPFVFFWQDKDGRMEIVDGSQRLRTIRDFMADKFALRDLETIPALNGFRFSDLPPSRQLKFGEIPIRVIILDNTTDAETRTEMFARINTGGTTANDAEIRRGSLPGPFMDLVIELANDETFVELTPISAELVNKREREELVTRFFAYLNSFDPAANDGDGDIVSYREEPRRFFFQFVKEMNDRITLEQENGQQSQTIAAMRTDFANALGFIHSVSPNGFTKSETGKQVPRVRFESIAVGSALALRADSTVPDRATDMTPLLESLDFLEATKSDAANVKSKLLNRIRLTRNWLLQQ